MFPPLETACLNKLVRPVALLVKLVLFPAMMVAFQTGDLTPPLNP